MKTIELNEAEIRSAIMEYVRRLYSKVMIVRIELTSDAGLMPGDPIKVQVIGDDDDVSMS